MLLLKFLIFKTVADMEYASFIITKAKVFHYLYLTLVNIQKQLDSELKTWKI